MRSKRGQFSATSGHQYVRGPGGKFNSAVRTSEQRATHEPVGVSSLDVKSVLLERFRRRTKDDEDEEVFDDGRLKGNFIINIPSLEKNMNICFKKHLKNYSECVGDLYFDQNYRKWGPGMLVGRMICSLCPFKSDFLNYFEEVEVETRGKGRLPTKVGIQLQVASSKQPISNNALNRLFAACDIAPGALSGMQRSANRVLDQVIKINDDQLRTNRRVVKETMSARTGVADPAILIESDAAYNNAPKGRSFYQPGTQVWQPVFCAEPGLSLPIEMATGSKLCSCDNKHGPDCQANFDFDKPIGNAEYELAQTSCKKIMGDEEPSSCLNVMAVVTDGDSHICKGFRKVAEELGKSTPEKADCTRHLTKRIGRNLNKTGLTIKGRTQAERSAKKQKLAFFIERRCAQEFRVAHAKYGKNIKLLICKCKGIIEGILGCIRGEWQTCRKYSLVCKHLTKKDDFKLDIPTLCSKADENIIVKWIRNKLGEEAIIGQQFNRTTNRCESSHLTTTKSVPKSRTFKRNFAGRVHSASHSMTFGEIKSTLKLNAQLGAKNVYLKARQTLSRMDEMHKSRRKSINYLRRRKRLRVLKKRRLDPRFKKDSYATGCNDPIVRLDHRYQMP